MEISLADRPVVSRQPPLYAWMVENWGELGKDEMSWPWLMGKIAEAGLTDGDGNPPSLRTAQNTLYRVRKAMTKQAKSALSASLAGRLAPGQSRPFFPATTTGTIPPEERFKPVRIRD